MGYEESELKPYKEPSKDVLDQGRIGKCARAQVARPFVFCFSFFVCTYLALLWVISSFSKVVKINSLWEQYIMLVLDLVCFGLV